MGKYKFKTGDSVVSKREPDKKGVIIGYNKETGEYQILLAKGNTHFESPRWLDKSNM